MTTEQFEKKAMSPKEWMLRGMMIGLMTLLTGCVHSRQAQLQAVAKDWCATMRASQVVPVYPLTEDLQPGDIFLVESPIVDQRRLYRSKGYLPFEGHLGRILPSYQEFYQGGFGVTEEAKPPRHWQFPNASNWLSAPIAGFPSYTFKVKSSQGLNAAFPISGIPVALALANSSTASGSVTLRDAHTFGLDEVRFEEEFSKWRRVNRGLLARHASVPEHPRFLRLVTRIYAVREFSVSLSHDGATSGGLTAGAGKTLDLFAAETTNLVANYSNVLSQLNKYLGATSAAAPGGALSVAAASSRTVSLNETFSRPLVVGYLASEYQILANGALGPAMSTREILESRVSDPVAETRRVIEDTQTAGGAIVGGIEGYLKGLTSAAELKAAAESAARLKVLARGEADAVAEMAGTDLTEARVQFTQFLFDYAEGGSQSNLKALRELADLLLRR